MRDTGQTTIDLQGFKKKKNGQGFFPNKFGEKPFKLLIYPFIICEF